METNSVNTPQGDHPESPASTSFKPPLVTIGYVLLLLSFVLYLLVEYAGEKENLFMIFWIHYIIAAVYTFTLIGSRVIGIQKSWSKENIDKTIIILNLFLLSAYALNRELAVFENSDDWLCVYIMISSITLLSYRYFAKFPRWVNILQLIFLGGAFTLYLYLVLYTFSYYIFGAIGILAFGIGAHILVPLFLALACINLFAQNAADFRASYFWAGAGICIPIGILVTFVAQWNLRVSEIETQANQSVMYDKTELPVWVALGESLKNDWISKRILKSDLVYTTASNNFGEWQFMPKTVSWDEARKHDPLVYISTLFSKCSLSEEDRVKILKVISQGRHQANERLWSGDNLTTSYVVSDVDIYTDLRIAYTEQYLNVRNNSVKGNWRGNTEEGIYTFYLPEGSVVTSLSLWINGKEEKGILTSKKKATEAYTTIVGIEQRDPSVIHWQEGNTVTVRVFPCTTTEERKFKMGITSPLHEESGQIIYKNIIFDGPSADAARETRRIRFIGTANTVSLGGNFKKR